MFVYSCLSRAAYAPLRLFPPFWRSHKIPKLDIFLKISRDLRSVPTRAEFESPTVKRLILSDQISDLFLEPGDAVAELLSSTRTHNFFSLSLSLLALQAATRPGAPLHQTGHFPRVVRLWCEPHCRCGAVTWWSPSLSPRNQLSACRCPERSDSLAG